MRRVLLAVTITLAGCNGSAGAPPLASPQHVTLQRGFASDASGGKITHVIYIVQEGRSFDDLFQGYPGAQTSSTGAISTGKVVKLRPISLTTRYEIDTSAEAMFAACNGTGKAAGHGLPHERF